MPIGGIQDFPKGADHGEHRARAYNGCLGTEPPVWSSSKVRRGGLCPWSWKPFVHFHTKKEQKLRI